MRKKEDIKRSSAEALAAEESKTDWVKVDAASATEVERLADDEDGPLPEGWENTVIIGLPPGAAIGSSASPKPRG